MRPSICVLMPVFQGARYIQDAVASVLRQTGVSLELLIRDDGSTDGSREYLKKITDPRVKVSFPEQRLGLFRGLNELSKSTCAELVRVLCQDDLLLPGCLQREVAFFETHPEVGYAMVKHRAIDETGSEIGLAELGDLPEVLLPELTVQQFLYNGCLPGNLSAVCWRDSLFRREGGFDEAFQVSADYALWSKFAPQVPFGVLHERLVSVRSHPKQLSRASTSQVPFVLENRAIRKTLLSHLPLPQKKAAAAFEVRCQGVLDWHQSVRLILAGRLREASLVWKSLGGVGVARALFYWILTLNNRIVPQAPWSLPRNP